MPTFDERLEQARQTTQVDAKTAQQQQEATWQSKWDATVEQLDKLIHAELDVTDAPKPEHLHKDYSHGSPETDYAISKMGNGGEFWIALPVSDDPAADTRLLSILHCPNGHVLGLEYPHGAGDTWDAALLRSEERNDFLRDTNKCPHCVAARTTAFPYIPRVNSPV